MQVLLSELQPPPIKVDEKSVSDEFQMTASSIKAEVQEEENDFKANCSSQCGTFITFTKRNIWPLFVRAVLMPDQIVHPVLLTGMVKISLLNSKPQL